MAASQSSEASEIRRRGRQRLIGAVAIALLLVVFVPMLLDSEPRSREDPKLDIPPRDNAVPLPAPTGAQGDKAPAPAPVDETKKPAAAKVAAVEPKPAPAPPKAAPAAPAKQEGFAVQVGAFHDEAKLQQVRDKLTAAKVTATYTEPAGELTRLRVGPFATRDQAEKA